jgi:hypothetical protein
MEAASFDQILQSFKQRRPFRPFTVVLVSGDRYEIDHPEALATREGVAIYLAPGSIPIFFDHEGVSQVIGDLMEQPEG